MLEVGAHQLCWLFLQALFMDASAPPTTMTASANSAAVFILSLHDAYPAPLVPTTHGYSRAVISRVRTPCSSTYQSPMIISIAGVAS